MRKSFQLLQYAHIAPHVYPRPQRALGMKTSSSIFFEILSTNIFNILAQMLTRPVIKQTAPHSLQHFKQNQKKKNSKIPSLQVFLSQVFPTPPHKFQLGPVRIYTPSPPPVLLPVARAWHFASTALMRALSQIFCCNDFPTAYRVQSFCVTTDIHVHNLLYNPYHGQSATDTRLEITLLKLVSINYFFVLSILYLAWASGLLAF